MSEVRGDAPSSAQEPPELQLIDRLALFFDAMIEFWSDGSSPDGGDIEEVARGVGLLSETVFNSDIHEDAIGVGVEDGEQWFVPTDEVTGAIRVALKRQAAVRAAQAAEPSVNGSSQQTTPDPST